MVKIFITALLVFTVSILNSQEFKLEYISADTNNYFFADIFESPDGDIFFCGGITSLESPKEVTSYIIKLDSQGFFADSIHIKYEDRSSFCYSIISNNSDGFLAVEAVYDSMRYETNSRFVVSLYDFSFNLQYRKWYVFPPEYKMDHLTAFTDFENNTIIGGAVVIDFNYPRPFLYVLDYEFDSVVAKFYTSDIGLAWKVRTLPDEGFWFIQSIGDRYYQTDSLLNKIEEQKIPDFLHGNIGVKWDTDTSFYLVADKLHPNPSHNLGFIRQFDPTDTTGHLFNQWGISDTIDLPAVNNGIDFKDKDSIFIGGTRNVYLGNYNPWPSWLIILQADSTLNIRWERFYGGDAYYVLGKVVATQDGGCLLGGIRYDYLNEIEERTDVIVVKLDANGIVVSDNKKPITNMHEAIVYPNPGTSEIKVRIAAQHPESLFQLFDIHGKLILTQEIIGKWGSINTGFLKSGTYIYRITSKQGLFESGKWVKQ